MTERGVTGSVPGRELDGSEGARYIKAFRNNIR